MMLKPERKNELWFVFPQKKKKINTQPNRQSIKEFEEFNMKSYDGENYIIGIDNTDFVSAGKVVAEAYLSDKEGERIEYIHKHHRPLPRLYLNSTGTVLLIKGGMLKIKDWLYK